MAIFMSLYFILYYQDFVKNVRIFESVMAVAILNTVTINFKIPEQWYILSRKNLHQLITSQSAKSSKTVRRGNDFAQILSISYLFLLKNT